MPPVLRPNGFDAFNLTGGYKPYRRLATDNT